MLFYARTSLSLSMLNLNLRFEWIFLRSIKEINRLINNGMTHVYLNSSVESLDSFSLKNLPQDQLFGSSNSHRDC